MAQLRQGQVYLTVQTPLGPDTVVLSEFSAREKVSDIYEFHLVMVADRNDINLEELTGQTATVAIEIQDTRDAESSTSASSAGLMQRVRSGLGGQKLSGLTKTTSAIKTLAQKFPSGGLSFGLFSGLSKLGGGLSKSIGGGLTSKLGGGLSGGIGDKITSLASNHMQSLNLPLQHEAPKGFSSKLLGKLTSRLNGDAEKGLPGGLLGKLGDGLSGKLGGGKVGSLGSLLGEQLGGGFGNTSAGGTSTGSGGITSMLLKGVSKRFGTDADAAPIGGMLSGLSGKLIDLGRGNGFISTVMDRLGGEETIRGKAQGLIDKLNEGQLEIGLKKITEGDAEAPGLLGRGQEILGKFFSKGETRPGLGWLTGGKGQGAKGAATGSTLQQAMERGPSPRRPGFGESIFPQTGPIQRDLSKQVRYFHGIIGEIAQGPTDLGESSNLTLYTAKLYPKLWLLKFSKNCRIFQNKTAMEIIGTVLQENDVTDIQDKTQSAGQTVREYCVQYNESNFDFISRLMEAEGIFYYFIHTESAHTLVLADSPEAHHQCPNTRQAIMEKKRGAGHYFNAIQDCDLIYRAVPKEHALTDYDFELPSNNLHTTSQGTGIGGRVYEYPGKYNNKADGDEIVRKRIESEELPRDMLYGTSTIPFFEPGAYFDLSGHSRADANKKYVLLQVDHQAKHDFIEGEETLYTNQFKAFNFSAVAYRPSLKTPKPRILGTQTARVTGKEGEEIWTDKYGRVKVKFHWDENEADDETTSCWVRVAQGWAGNGWGILFTPRIGHEVVVSFLEGDPDRPLITGSVYNGEKMAPYLPDRPTVSTIKSQSSKESDGFNEIRFEDLTYQEQVYMHAQKDMDIEIENNLSTTIHAGDETKTIESGSRTVTLLAEDKETKEGTMHSGTGDDTLVLDKGSRSVHLKALGAGTADHTTQLDRGDHTLKILQGNQNVILDSGDQKRTITGNEVTNITGNVTQDVGGNYTIKIMGNLEIDVTGSITMRGQSFMLETLTSTSVDAGTSISMKAAADISTTAGVNVSSEAGVSFKASSGASADVEAGGMASFKAGGITTITGALVKIN